jgi:hypothetical protein
MKSEQESDEDIINQIYEYAANLLANENKNKSEVVQILIEEGIDAESAKVITDNIEVQIRKAKRNRANKDMLCGALWCIGGIVATMADLGYIFWGAIVFGGIQFFKGVSNL